MNTGVRVVAGAVLMALFAVWYLLILLPDVTGAV
jgi:hypothetical protein